MSARRLRWAEVLAEALTYSGESLEAQANNFLAARLDPGLQLTDASEARFVRAARECVGELMGPWLAAYPAMFEDIFAELGEFGRHVIVPGFDHRARWIDSFIRALYQRTGTLHMLLMAMELELEGARRFPPRGPLELADRLGELRHTLYEFVVLIQGGEPEPEPRRFAGVVAEHFALWMETALDRPLSPAEDQRLFATVDAHFAPSELPVAGSRPSVYDELIALALDLTRAG